MPTLVERITSVVTRIAEEVKVPAIVRSALTSLAGTSGLRKGRYYLVEDEGRIAFATSTSTTVDVPLPSEISGGSSILGGVATVTIPTNRRDHEETVAALGVVPGNIVFATLAPGTDSDENNAEFLDALVVVGTALTDQIRFTLTFDTPQVGPIKINWSVL